MTATSMALELEVPVAPAHGAHATMIASGILLLDFVVASLHRERRSLHDLAAGTIVVSET